MKIIITLLIGVLIGGGIGWHFGYKKSDAELASAVREQLESDERGQAVAAMFAAQTVKYIDSGDTQKALQTLSFPIASYYSVYAIRSGTNAERLKVRSYIDQFAASNQIVAAQIAKELNYGKFGQKAE
jgi:hypothetical protein